jgi:transposase
MGEVNTIGLDVAKSVFQVHGVDGTGAVVMRKRISRSKVLEFFGELSPCLVGLEACPSAYYWSRELQALGHTVKLMPPSYVKAYLKRSKNDANDAAAICEAETRPSMRFVPIKTQVQQTGPDAAPEPTIDTNHGSPTCKGGGSCTRQQDRTDGLGDHGSWRAIQRTEAVAGGLNTPIGEGITT